MLRHTPTLSMLFDLTGDIIQVPPPPPSAVPSDDINTMSFTSATTKIPTKILPRFWCMPMELLAWELRRPTAETWGLSIVGPPNYSFDDIKTMSFTTLLPAQIAEW